jgi:hypothetical protein
MLGVMTTDATGRRVRGPLKRTGKGAYWRAERNCWTARITITTRDKKEKNIHLGNFDKEADALKARKKAEENLKVDPHFYG